MKLKTILIIALSMLAPFGLMAQKKKGDQKEVGYKIISDNPQVKGIFFEVDFLGGTFAGFNSTLTTGLNTVYHTGKVMIRADYDFN
ncbi:MAG: hypothetical protein HRT71_11015 [Flavobacteriales bacterium]|nr:hypothetical protein [Flavobacteriales bacterium]